MTYEQISEMLAEVGIPYAYYQFPNDSGQQPPFLCFYYSNDGDFKADNTNYQKIEALTIELYTDSKDFDLEQSVEGILTEHDLVYSRNETEIDSEQMHLTTYYTEVIINA